MTAMPLVLSEKMAGNSEYFGVADKVDILTELLVSSEVQAADIQAEEGNNRAFKTKIGDISFQILAPA